MNYVDFIKSAQNKRYLLIAVVGTTIQFIIFKLLYPFADFFSDSYSYIYAAYANLDVSIWPIGYSKFLRLFHLITHSDTALIAFQYFFLELTCLYFFFTILFFYKPPKISRNILFGFLFFNPLFLYISNFVNSDPLFAALSMWWFTELLWIIQRPRGYQIIVQATLLFLCFTIRNNAYYYPLITVLAFALSKQALWRKVVGISLGIGLIIPFILFTREAAYKLTGTRQFSLFTGWQLANNALYMYEHIEVDNKKLPTPEAREIDTLAKDFFNRRIKPGFDNALTDYVANFFIRQPEAPLKRYFSHHYKAHNDYSLVVAWGKAAVPFESFGKYLIAHYPVSFARHFVLRNTKNYFIPPLEKLEVYNLGEDEVDPVAVAWFHYRNEKITSVSKTVQGTVLFILPLLFTLLNFYIVAGVVMLLFKRRYQQLNNKMKQIIVLSGSLILLNMGFCITTTIIVFRYEFFPMTICLLLSLLLLPLIEKQVNVLNINKDNVSKKREPLLQGH